MSDANLLVSKKFKIFIIIEYNLLMAVNNKFQNELLILMSN
jgi:hypothetical protein